MSEPRTITTPIARVRGWLDGFAARNGAISRTDILDGEVRLSTATGGQASIKVSRLPQQLPSSDQDELFDALTEAIAGRPQSVAVILIRRGGYSIARVSTRGTSHEVLASKTDQKYVQGRTAAGGQSQQRFARRRAGQTAGLVRAATDTAVRLLTGDFAYVVTGGDIPLIDDVLADARLRAVASLRRQHVDVAGNPRRRSIDNAIEAARAVTITVQNAPSN